MGPGSDPAPILLRSMSAAILTDRVGDLSLVRESRGAVQEWGGVYAQLVRLTGPWRIFLWDGSRQYRLADGSISGAQVGDRWRSEHRLGRISVHQEIAPTDAPSGAIRRLRFSLAEGPPVSLVVHSSFRPYLLPTLVEGVRPVSFRAQTSAAGLDLRQRGFGLSVRSSIAPSHLYLDGGSWLGGRRTGPLDQIGIDYEVVVAPGADVELDLVIVGGLERDLVRSTDEIDSLLADPERRHVSAETAEAAWRAGTPSVRLPDAPELERGYESARASLRRLYTAPGDSLTGLVAGYPWYSAIWCRDLAWMLPAILWLGDFDWTSRSLVTVFRFQSRSSIPLLGGEPGELPMQISPGPIFFYGTSDTTLYFPDLVERLVRHGGDAEAVRPLLPGVRRVIAWGLARIDPATGLLRNGGEAEEISAATGSISRIRYGIDSPDTTIWDSTDRRDHAIDVQVLWWTALRSALDVAAVDDDPALRARLPELFEQLGATIRSAYDWPEERYLADSIRAGTPVRKLRPNALRAIGAGLIDPGRARGMVERATEEDLSTSWGLRTLSTKDPAYRPDAYHDGQVWPIATAWAADAAFATGNAELGVALLGRMAGRYALEGGDANECYRGDRAEPFDSCFLLGLSVGPFVSVLFERLWGLRPDARTLRLEIRPCFPSAWRSASLDGVRVGAGRVSLRWETPLLNVLWSGPGVLTATVGGEERSVPAGASVAMRLTAGDRTAERPAGFNIS
ncbi:MAG: amylo-alpha-1,6-glucosidase [Thermoplasmata archaeon]